jgi:hypothetical protein
MELRDANLKKTVALPNGAATVYMTPGFDLGISTALGKAPGQVEFLLSAPAMNTTQMPDAKTMKYSILVDTVNPVDGSSVILMQDVITQTGAGGVGCAAATYRFRLPSSIAALANATIVGIRAIGSAAGDATGANATLEVLA